jgi:hypothetical protein
MFGDLRVERIEITRRTCVRMNGAMSILYNITGIDCAHVLVRTQWFQQPMWAEPKSRGAAVSEPPNSSRTNRLKLRRE